jgi:intracellular multiplication protein IcmB
LFWGVEKMAFVDFLEGMFRGVSEVSRTGYARFLTDLETADDDVTFALNDGSLSSLIRVDGIRTMVGAEEFSLLSNVVTDALSMMLKSEGRTVAFYYAYDPFYKDDVRQAFSGMRQTAKNFKVDMDDVFDDWERSVGNYTHGESVYTAITSRTSLLTGYQRRMQKNIMQANNRGAIPLHDSVWGSQRINNIATEIRSDHAAMVSSFIDKLGKANIISERCDVRDAIRAMRSALSPTGRHYEPILPGDRIPVRVKDKVGAVFGPRDVLEINYPSLHRQIFREPLVLEKGAVRVGDRWFQGIVMDVPPENLNTVYFNSLFRVINEAPDPFRWRMGLHVDGGGLNLLGWNDMFATLFAGTSSVNRRFNKAVKELRAMYEDHGLCIARFKCAFSVEAESYEQLRIYTARMVSAINGWGNADAAKPLGAGQPLAVCATIPGLVSKNPGPGAAAPVPDIARFLPLTRPAKIWKDGTPFRTRDGSFAPYREGSSKQASFIEIGVGPLGTGKSGNLNVMNLAYVFGAGQPRMPYLSVVDIGPSSSGAISIIREGLPTELKHLAVYERIRMEKKYAVNPFDTWTGLRFPTPSQKGFMVNLLTLIGTPIGHDSDGPPIGVPGLADTLVETAFRMFSDDYSPKLYQANIESDSVDVTRLDEAIVREGLHIDDKTSWWEVVDAFFGRGMIHEAEVASRYAVPTLRDISSMVKDESIAGMYGKDLTDSFWLACNEAIRQYPILSSPTRFTLRGARIVALDLDEVAIKGSAVAERQTAVMYMLARHVVLSRFFFEEQDIHSVPEIPFYKEYYRDFYQNLRVDHKRIGFDELHRVTQNSTVASQIISDINTVIRESRKWNIHLGFYSQKPEDIPPDFRDLATTVFVFGVNQSEKLADFAAEWFSMGETAADRMASDLDKPSKAGSTIIAKYVMDTGGQAVQSLMSTVGPITLWAISTTGEDADLRNRLYRDLGPANARRLLAEVYPSGSVKDLYEELRNKTVDYQGNLGAMWEPLYQKVKTAGNGKPVDAMEMIYLYLVQRAKDNKML